MPRAETSQAGRIVNYFRTAHLETAELVLGLAKDAIRERKATAGVSPVAKTARAAKTAGRPRRKKATNGRAAESMPTLTGPAVESAQ
jgi:hypothetical protein